MVGCEWLVDASGCDPALLRAMPVLVELCERVVRELGLTVCGPPLWRGFPEPGGVTGLYLLSESHLSCHTWPEHGVATFNLFCCQRRRDWAWVDRLSELLGARAVQVRCLRRGGERIPGQISDRTAVWLPPGDEPQPEPQFETQLASGLPPRPALDSRTSGVGS